MDQKRKLSVFSKLIFLLMSFTLVLLMGIKADARPKEWTELEGQWYCADGNVYYIIGNTFYVSPMEPHSMGERHKIAGWKTVDGEYLKIVHGYGNKVFINKIDELDGSSILYAVDIKTKNKAKISGKCSITAASGRYMYGNAEKASDTGAYPVFIWKISGNSVKKGKTLGKFIFGTTAIKNKIYSLIFLLLLSILLSIFFLLTAFWSFHKDSVFRSWQNIVPRILNVLPS